MRQTRLGAALAKSRSKEFQSETVSPGQESQKGPTLSERSDSSTAGVTSWPDVEPENSPRMTVPSEQSLVGVLWTSFTTPEATQEQISSQCPTDASSGRSI